MHLKSAAPILILGLCIHSPGCNRQGEATSLKPEGSRIVGTDGGDWTAENDDGESIEIKQLPPLELETAGEHEYFAEEDPGASFCVDPQSGKIRWRAIVCENPDCGGRGDGEPNVFTQPVENPPLTADGQVNHAAWDKMAIAHFYSMKCPVCGGKKHLRPYDPPAVVERRQLLLDQLAAARAARRKAQQSGETWPENLRSPNDIMRDLDSLPKLYISADE